MKSSISLLAFFFASGVFAVNAAAQNPAAVSPANELCDSWKTLYSESLATVGWNSTFPGTQYVGSLSAAVDIWAPERLVIIWGAEEVPGSFDPLNPQAVCSASTVTLLEMSSSGDPINQVSFPCYETEACRMAHSTSTLAIAPAGMLPVYSEANPVPDTTSAATTISNPSSLPLTIENQSPPQMSGPVSMPTGMESENGIPALASTSQLLDPPPPVSAEEAPEVAAENTGLSWFGELLLLASTMLQPPIDKDTDRDKANTANLSPITAPPKILNVDGTKPAAVFHLDMLIDSGSRLHEVVPGIELYEEIKAGLDAAAKPEAAEKAFEHFRDMIERQLQRPMSDAERLELREILKGVRTSKLSTVRDFDYVRGADPKQFVTRVAAKRLGFLLEFESAELFFRFIKLAKIDGKSGTASKPALKIIDRADPRISRQYVFQGQLRSLGLGAQNFYWRLASKMSLSVDRPEFPPLLYELLSKYRSSYELKNAKEFQTSVLQYLNEWFENYAKLRELEASIVEAESLAKFGQPKPLSLATQERFKRTITALTTLLGGSPDADIPAGHTDTRYKSIVEVLTRMLEAGIPPESVETAMLLNSSKQDFLKIWGDKAVTLETLKQLRQRIDPLRWHELKTPLEVLAAAQGVLPETRMQVLRRTAANGSMFASVLNLLDGFTRNKFDEKTWVNLFPNIPFTSFNVGRMLGLPQKYIAMKVDELGGKYVAFVVSTGVTTAEITMFVALDKVASGFVSTRLASFGALRTAVWVKVNGIFMPLTPAFAYLYGASAFEGIDFLSAPNSEIFLRTAGSPIGGAILGLPLAGIVGGPLGMATGAVISSAATYLAAVGELNKVQKLDRAWQNRLNARQRVVRGAKGWLLNDNLAHVPLDKPEDIPAHGGMGPVTREVFAMAMEQVLRVRARDLIIDGKQLTLPLDEAKMETLLRLYSQDFTGELLPAVKEGDTAAESYPNRIYRFRMPTLNEQNKLCREVVGPNAGQVAPCVALIDSYKEVRELFGTFKDLAERSVPVRHEWIREGFDQRHVLNDDLSRIGMFLNGQRSPAEIKRAVTSYIPQFEQLYRYDPEFRNTLSRLGWQEKDSSYLKEISAEMNQLSNGSIPASFFIPDESGQDSDQAMDFLVANLFMSLPRGDGKLRQMVLDDYLQKNKLTADLSERLYREAQFAVQFARNICSELPETAETMAAWWKECSSLGIEREKLSELYRGSYGNHSGTTSARPVAVFIESMNEIYSGRPAALLERLKLLSKEFGTADIARKTPLSTEEVSAFRKAILADFYRQKKSEDSESETPSGIDFSSADYFPNAFTGVTEEYAKERMRVRCREGGLFGTVSKKQLEREDSKGVISAVSMDHGYVANCAASEAVLMLFPHG